MFLRKKALEYQGLLHFSHSDLAESLPFFSCLCPLKFYHCPLRSRQVRLRIDEGCCDIGVTQETTHRVNACAHRYRICRKCMPEHSSQNGSCAETGDATNATAASVPIAMILETLHVLLIAHRELCELPYRSPRNSVALLRPKQASSKYYGKYHQAKSADEKMR